MFRRPCHMTYSAEGAYIHTSRKQDGQVEAADGQVMLYAAAGWLNGLDAYPQRRPIFRRKVKMDPELHIARYFQNFEICTFMLQKIRRTLLGVDDVGI